MTGSVWDAVVVGAGPAGSVVARELARRGLAVLLADRAMFPRGKVCGCCLNGSALGALAAVGLGDLPARLGAVTLTGVRLAAGGRAAQLRLPAGVALSREAFDAGLIREAVAAGVRFVPGVTAKLRPGGEGVREVELVGMGGRNPSPEGGGEKDRKPGTHTSTRTGKPPVPTAVAFAPPPALGEGVGGRGCGPQTLVASARVVIAADGLNGRLVAADGDRPTVADGSRIGAGVVATDAPTFYRPGTIYMAVGRGGYVGLVRLEDGRLDVAAAFDPDRVRAAGGPGPAAVGVLADAGLPALPSLADLAWRGTPPLTRTARRLSGPGWFAVGDAAGYVEPFTGEGMAWAVTSGAAVAPLAARVAAAGWTADLGRDWQRTHARLVKSRQGVCRAAAGVLRSPTLSRLAVAALSVAPVLSRPVVAALNRPSRRLLAEPVA